MGDISEVDVDDAFGLSVGGPEAGRTVEVAALLRAVVVSERVQMEYPRSFQKM